MMPIYSSTPQIYWYCPCGGTKPGDMKIITVKINLFNLKKQKHNLSVVMSLSSSVYDGGLLLHIYPAIML